MEQNLKKAKVLVNKIIKNLKRNDLDWTVQASVNSVKPDSVTYACQIQEPANGLQPITWVKNSWEELEKSLKISAENLNTKEVEKAWHQAEIERARTVIKFHEEELDTES